MPRAKKRCAQVGCREYAPCPKHKVWQPSSGTRPLPGDWKSLRKKARGYDEKRCYICHKIRTNGAVDHIIPRSQGGPHHPANLAWICNGPGSCHEQKTEAEKQAGRKRSR